MGTIIAMAASGLARVKWWRAREVSDTRTQHLRSTFHGDQCGKVLCCFQNAAKFKTRYSTFGFSDEANLDEGAMWPTSFALMELTATKEAKISALVKKAVR